MADLDNRVAILELRADNTDEKTKALSDTQKTFGDSLLGIEKVLIQIKYALYGAGVVVAVNYLGIKEVVTRLILH
jgi:hypothetical protein